MTFNHRREKLFLIVFAAVVSGCAREAVPPATGMRLADAEFPDVRITLNGADAAGADIRLEPETTVRIEADIAIDEDELPRRKAANLSYEAAFLKAGEEGEEVAAWSVLHFPMGAPTTFDLVNLPNGRSTGMRVQLEGSCPLDLEAGIYEFRVLARHRSLRPREERDTLTVFSSYVNVE